MCKDTLIKTPSLRFFQIKMMSYSWQLAPKFFCLKTFTKACPTSTTRLVRTICCLIPRFVVRLLWMTETTSAFRSHPSLTNKKRRRKSLHWLKDSRQTNKSRLIPNQRCRLLPSTEELRITHRSSNQLKRKMSRSFSRLKKKMFSWCILMCPQTRSCLWRQKIKLLWRLLMGHTTTTEKLQIRSSIRKEATRSSLKLLIKTKATR